MNDQAAFLPRIPVIACHECGLIQRMRPLPVGARACCGRCGAVLYRERRDSLHRVLMLTFAALILFVLAHAFPFMTFKLEGREQLSTLLSGVVGLFRDGMWPLAAPGASAPPRCSRCSSCWATSASCCRSTSGARRRWSPGCSAGSR